MQIKILGAHNTESKDTKHVTLLIDEVLAVEAGALASSLSFAEQQRIKAILLTHHHYDHIRDIPAVAMNAFLHEARIHVYSTQTVYDALANYLLNGELYPRFLTRPEDNPTIQFTVLAPGSTVKIAGYTVMAVPMTHSIPAVGFQVTSPRGKTVFYTGDTGADLTECWRSIMPQLLIIEVTMSNRWEEYARMSGHLTPGMLKQELEHFRELNGYLPQVIAVHMVPGQEEEIAAELAVVSADLGHTIALAREGMQVRL
ncbi:MBL fold metallo-hydrolase [Chloroflexota bacterium]